MGAIQRIVQFIEYKGISKYKFYQETGLSNGFLDKGENMGSDKCEKILYTYPDINPEWLLTGRGSMLKEKEVAFQEPQLAISADIQRIPIVDLSAAAGTGYINPNYVEEIDSIALPVTMLKNGKQYLCVRVKGHSMLPSILDGGYLIIRMLDRSEWGSIRDNYVYVVSDVEGKAYVKRLKNRLKQHGFIVCMSDNADKLNYPNFNIEEDEINSVWYAEWYFSAKIPNIQEVFYRKQAELEEAVEQLKEQFQEFRNTLKPNI